MNFYFLSLFLSFLAIFCDTMVKKNAIFEVKMPKTMIDFDREFYQYNINFVTTFHFDIEGSMNFDTIF